MNQLVMMHFQLRISILTRSHVSSSAARSHSTGFQLMSSCATTARLSSSRLSPLSSPSSIASSSSGGSRPSSGSSGTGSNSPWLLLLMLLLWFITPGSGSPASGACCANAGLPGWSSHSGPPRRICSRSQTKLMNAHRVHVTTQHP